LRKNRSSVHPHPYFQAASNAFCRTKSFDSFHSGHWNDPDGLEVGDDVGGPRRSAAEIQRERALSQLGEASG
jgi:hypothetical protein